jgi:valyl-tRNA synthetase
MDVAPSKKISAVLDCKTEISFAIMDAGQKYIGTLATVSDLNIGVDVERPAQAATQVAGDVEILLPLAGLIDVGEEEKRLEKEIGKVEKDVAMFSKKLSNEKFVSNAPPEVLEKDRGKLAAAEEKLGILQESLKKIQALK